MMNQIFLIKQLLEYLEMFNEERGQGDLQSFSIYLNARVLGDSPMQLNGFGIQKNSEKINIGREMDFSQLFSILYRVFKNHVKWGLKDHPIKSVEEFGLLLALLKEQSLMKHELIKSQVLEISSGSEILKRLIAKDLINEFKDETDGRAKRVILSEKGRKLIEELINRMQLVSRIMLGDLSEKELNEALQIFNKLNYFHHRMKRKGEFKSLEEMYMYIEEKNKIPGHKGFER